MRHYVETKNLHPEAFLFYRLGDFYELFFQDAIDASKLLDLTLTKKSGGLKEKIPMCGVPYRVANQYISRLVNMGHKVSICDQVEDPKEAKGLVKREITRIVTPSTFTDTQFLKNDSNQFLMAIWIENQTATISYCDYLTGNLYLNENIFLNEAELRVYLNQQYSFIQPSEVIFSEKNPYKNVIYDINKKYSNPLITELNDTFLEDNILSSLQQLSSKIKYLKGKNILFNQNSILLILNYLSKTQMNSLNHITDILLEKKLSYLNLSESTKYNLELIRNIRENTKKNTLFELLDSCITSMGSRLLKKWIQKPLINEEEILNRQKFIQSLHNNRITQDYLREDLNKIYDFDRLAVKISQHSLTPKNLDQLRKSLNAISNLKQNLINSSSHYLKNFSKGINDLKNLAIEIDKIIIEDPSNNFTEERFIKEGYDFELDDLFKNSDGGLEWLLDLEKKEQKRTGIKNLKIKFNKILGYFFEVTKSNLDLIPEDFIRKQTLVGSERFYTLELKEKESMILSGKDKALNKQIEILDNTRQLVFSYLQDIQNLANTVAIIDCLYSLSIIADKNNYVCPNFNHNQTLEIKDGRHPVVEAHLNLEHYVPNDVYMDSAKHRIQIITGPNMAGKSTYMRQTAIIVIMAQIGSFVPASSANLPILDHIFTRIGASDNLASGQSTFMVEMMEVSEIINNLTSNSLVLLDEVGRGTSTHDGLSIATALIEYLSTKSQAKIFFATHYYQLTFLKDRFSNVYNLTIATEQDRGEIRFLRKIIPGESNHSYGIQVARLAGVNSWITTRAQEILQSLEDKDNPMLLPLSSNITAEKEGKDLDKYNEYKEVLEQIKNLDVNSITPIEAIYFLNKFKEKIKEF